jgi:hypothetical protein
LKLSIRQVDAFKKKDGHWRIIQQHLSVPVDQKNSTAIFVVQGSRAGRFRGRSTRPRGPSGPVVQAKVRIITWLSATEVPKSIDEMAG